VLKVRYLEALTPAPAALVGVGIAVLFGLDARSAAPGRVSVPAISTALVCCCAYAFSIADPAVAATSTMLALGAIGAAVHSRSRSQIAGRARHVGAALAVGSCLVFPLHESVAAISSRSADAGGLMTLPNRVQRSLSSYLDPRTASEHYELAVDEPFGLAPLIIHDARPILPLTSFGTQVVTLGELQRAVRTGAVRYALMYTCQARPLLACGSMARWVRAHGTDVSSGARLPQFVRLYRLN
jgi:hypothetical protein